MRGITPKKTICFSIIFFLLASGFFTIINPSIAVDVNRNKTLYVGGSGLGNYTKIQDAIDDAFEGDMVFVYDDLSPYIENVVINKPIELIGEKRESTIIDGMWNGCAVKILADCIILKGFTLQNWGHALYYYYSAVELHSNYSSIENNIIKNNYTEGIYLSTSSKNIIRGNIIATDKATCIHLSFSHNNTIENNTLTGENLNGIYLGWSDNNSIVNNSFYQSSDILSDFSNKTIIAKNKMFLFGQQAAAIDIHGSECLISNNVIQTHGGTGLVLNMCMNALVSKNNFFSNHIDAICYYCVDNRISTNAGPMLSKNIFENNYWNEQRTLPKPIGGLIIVFFPVIIPWIQFDWNPAHVPYDILENGWKE